MTSLPLPDTAAIRAISDLRKQLLRRSLTSYAAWVRDAIGWSCVVYLLIFVIAFLISGLDTIPVFDPPRPISFTGQVTGILIALIFLYQLLPRRVAPVTLSRQDLYRLVLSPLPSWQVVRWPLLRTWSLSLLVGVITGGLWTFIAFRIFGVSAYSAAPALGLLFCVLPSLKWLTYLRRDQLNTWIMSRRWQLIGLAGGIAGIIEPTWGLAAPFIKPLSPGLLWYLIVASGATLDVRRSLSIRYPPSFGHQCHLRNRLRHLTLSRFITGELYDPAIHRRLLRQLRGRVIAIKPRFVLSPLPPDSSHIRLVAWRSILQLMRRPFRYLVKMIVLALGGGLLAGFIRDDLFSILYGISLLGMLYSDMLGPPLRPEHIPIRPLHRTVGRVLPGYLFIAVLTVLALGIGSFFITWFAAVTEQQLPFTSMQIGVILFKAETTLLLGMVGLEKIATLSRQSHRRMQIFGAAAFLSILPSLMVGNSGSPWLAGILNLLAVAAFLLLDR